jgi:hypothetical protein
VTVYLENGGRLEHAQQMAAHESPRTTKLYDRTKDEITIGELGFEFITYKRIYVSNNLIFTL